MNYNIAFDTDRRIIDVTDEYGEGVEPRELLDTLELLKEALEVICDPNSELSESEELDVFRRRMH